MIRPMLSCKFHAMLRDRVATLLVFVLPILQWDVKMSVAFCNVDSFGFIEKNSLCSRQFLCVFMTSSELPLRKLKRYGCSAGSVIVQSGSTALAG